MALCISIRKGQTPTRQPWADKVRPTNNKESRTYPIT